MKLPNGHRAVVDVAKLRDYCLNPDHLRGQHKARVFRARLGLRMAHVEWLRGALLNAARTNDSVVRGRSDRFGTRYLLDFRLDGPEGSGQVRSVWIVRDGERFPRLTTCYVL